MKCEREENVHQVSMYKVIGVRGGDDYLLVDRTAEEPKMARVLLTDGRLSPWIYLPAIMARGYWEHGTLPDDELDALLAAAEIVDTDVRSRRGVDIAEERTPTEADIERWTGPITADPAKLTATEWDRVLAVRRAWQILHATGDRSELVRLGILPARSTS